MNTLNPLAFEDPYKYWHLIKDSWAAGEPFIIIEHDIEVSDKVIELFESCPSPWCFNSYPIGGYWKDKQFHPDTLDDGSLWPDNEWIEGVQIGDIGGAALGCSRFRPSELLNIFDHDMLNIPTHWANMDVHITTILKLAEFTPHRHYPNVRHLHG